MSPRGSSAYTEPEERLTPSAHTFEKFRQAFNRVEHADGALPALEIARIERLIPRNRIQDGRGLLRVVVAIDGIVQRSEQLVLIVVVKALHLRRLQALPEEMIDRAQQ